MPYKYNNARRHKFKPKKYKIANWRDYNQALVSRGDITIWFSCDAANKWYAEPCRKHGAQFIYSDTAIEVAGLISLVFRLPLRQTTGFLGSIAKLMRVDLRMPNYSTLSRRLGKLEPHKKIPQEKHSMHVIVDASGLSVYGADEFHKTKKGLTKFSGYRVLHIAMNEHQEILACELTDKHGSENQQVKKLLKPLNNTYSKLIDDFNFDAGDKFTYEYNFFIDNVVDIRIEKIINSESRLHVFCIKGNGMPGANENDDIELTLELLKRIAFAKDEIDMNDINPLIDEITSNRFFRVLLNRRFQSELAENI